VARRLNWRNYVDTGNSEAHTAAELNSSESHTAAGLIRNQTFAVAEAGAFGTRSSSGAAAYKNYVETFASASLEVVTARALSDEAYSLSKAAAERNYKNALSLAKSLHSVAKANSWSAAVSIHRPQCGVVRPAQRTMPIRREPVAVADRADLDDYPPASLAEGTHRLVEQEFTLASHGSSLWM
jgi:hypothetical protein